MQMAPHVIDEPHALRCELDRRVLHPHRLMVDVPDDLSSLDIRASEPDVCRMQTSDDCCSAALCDPREADACCRTV
ncbi:hypothetical protein GW17_00012806 [Ensete ventricosum]|nr:hypothetical protein GW17_00012806 [Ensete ventricosum]RZR79341.1 hypothetical protein BHM03_00005057 [Ensete ventricosum]